MKKALQLVGYCRTSTENQKREGTVKVQEAELRKYAKKNGHDLLATFADSGVSGGLEYRRGLGALLNFLEKNPNVDGILIFKLDRLAREMRIQENLIHDLTKKKGKILISIKEPDLDLKDPIRILTRQILGSFSQYEKHIISLRLQSGRLFKACNGGYAGGARPHGYSSKDKDLEVDPDQAVTIKKIFYLKRYKKMSLRAIANCLNDEHIPTSRGKKWYASTVSYVLKNKLYKGVLEYKGEKTKRMELCLIP